MDEGREIKGHLIVEVDRDGYSYACARCGLHFTFRDVMLRLKLCRARQTSTPGE